MEGSVQSSFPKKASAILVINHAKTDIKIVWFFPKSLDFFALIQTFCPELQLQKLLMSSKKFDITIPESDKLCLRPMKMLRLFFVYVRVV